MVRTVNDVIHSYDYNLQYCWYSHICKEIHVCKIRDWPAQVVVCQVAAIQYHQQKICKNNMHYKFEHYVLKWVLKFLLVYLQLSQTSEHA